MSLDIPMRREGSHLVPVDAVAARLYAMSIPEPNSGCLLWLGTASKGYGYLRLNGKMQIASRVSYQTFVGEVGDHHVCHHCDNTYCIEPNHLFLGDVISNMADREAKGRTWKKLTNEQVRIVRSSADKGYELAERYGVSQALISIVRSGKWRGHQ